MQTLLYSQSRDVRPSVCHTLVLYQNEQTVMISLPTDSPNTLVFADIKFIPKFGRSDYERGR